MSAVGSGDFPELGGIGYCCLHSCINGFEPTGNIGFNISQKSLTSSAKAPSGRLDSATCNFLHDFAYDTDLWRDA